MERWKPHVTVAAVVENQGRFLMVKEHTAYGIRYNQPAGHLEAGETLLQAVVRETLEETAWEVEPTGLLGIYQADSEQGDITYMRFAFICRPVEHHPQRPLDSGIIEAQWLTPAEIEALQPQHRGPSVSATLQDALSASPGPLTLLHAL
jgi:phosphatase NudJ